MRAAAFVAITGLATVAGAAIGIACIPCERDAPVPVADGRWDIVGGRTNLVNGTVELSGDEVLIQFERDDGTPIEVRYDVVDRVP